MWRHRTLYVSVLTRSHVRHLAPLPRDELLALRRSMGELASSGRNINQIATVANEGGGLSRSAREEFHAMLRICESLRDNTKALRSAMIVASAVTKPRSRNAFPLPLSRRVSENRGSAFLLMASQAPS